MTSERHVTLRAFIFWPCMVALVAIVAQSCTGSLW
jgi:hypothetical protein